MSKSIIIGGYVRTGIRVKQLAGVLFVAFCCSGFTIKADAASIVTYTFADGNSGIATNTGTLGAAMNGTIVGGTITSSPFSPDNKALLLGGSAGNGISLPNGYDFGAEFTVESLARLDIIQNSQNILFDDFGAPGVLLTVDTNTEQLRFNLTTANNGTISLVSASPFSLGQWHHVAGVYDGSVMQLYLDGVLVASQSATGLVQNNALVTPNIGVESDGTVFPWLGAIDDFRIHDSALSVTNFNGGNPLPNIPLPGAIWLFGSGLLGLICLARRKKA